MIVFIFIAMLFTICLVLVIGLVAPRQQMDVHSEIIIDRPLDVTWAYVKLLRHQEHYNIGLRQDPNIKMQYTGIDGTPGFVAAWQSRSRMGDGEQQIIQIIEGERIETELRFKNHDSVTQVITSLDSVSSGQTKVSTVMSATPSFPMSMLTSLLRKTLAKDLAKNSAALKQQIEKI